MRILAATLLLILLGGPALLAQQRPQQERVYIKYYDGSIFVGSVVKASQFSMDLQIVTMDTITVQLGLITKMRNAKDLQLYPGGKYHFKTGIYTMMTAGGGSNGDSGSAQWDFTAAYRLRKDVHVGAGVGLEGGEIKIAGFFYFQDFTSVYGYGRYYPFGQRKRIRTFVDSKLGYGIPRNEWDGEHSGGVQIQPGVGWEFASRNNFRFLVTLSQYLQNTSGESTEFGPFSQPLQTSYNVWYNRTMIKIGIQFK